MKQVALLSPSHLVHGRTQEYEEPPPPNAGYTAAPSGMLCDAHVSAALYAVRDYAAAGTVPRPSVLAMFGIPSLSLYTPVMGIVRAYI